MSNEEQELRPKFHYAVSTEIKDIVLETAKNNENNIVRIRLVTDLGNVTYRTQKTKLETTKKQGFKTEQKKDDIYTMDDLKAEHEVLFALNTAIQKEPQTIVISYTEKDFKNEQKGITETFLFMRGKQMYTLYFAGFHKDKNKIEEQKNLQKHYTEKSMN